MSAQRPFLAEPMRRLLERWMPVEEWHWRHRSIPKSDGGTRTLRIPVPPLLRDLKRLNGYLLAPLDDCEWSYCRKNLGAARAIRAHAKHPYLLHRDLASFFPSTTSKRIEDSLISLRFGVRNARLIAAVCTCDDQLPQGSPASVTLGNLVLRGLDVRIGRLCQDEGLTYTRYVDDIAVSGGARLQTWVAEAIDDIIATEGWVCGSKGGLFAPGVTHLYLGAIVNGVPRPKDETMSRLFEWLDLLKSGDSSVLSELQGLVTWYRTLDSPRGDLLKASIDEISRSIA